MHTVIRVSGQLRAGALVKFGAGAAVFAGAAPHFPWSNKSNAQAASGAQMYYRIKQQGFV
jgi:hypothetical protein